MFIQMGDYESEVNLLSVKIKDYIKFTKLSKDVVKRFNWNDDFVNPQLSNEKSKE